MQKKKEKKEKSKNNFVVQLKQSETNHLISVDQSI